jgi:hypothetical protein
MDWVVVCYRPRGYYKKCKLSRSANPFWLSHLRPGDPFRLPFAFTYFRKFFPGNLGMFNFFYSISLNLYQAAVSSCGCHSVQGYTPRSCQSPCRALQNFFIDERRKDLTTKPTSLILLLAGSVGHGSPVSARARYPVRQSSVGRATEN